MTCFQLWVRGIHSVHREGHSVPWCGGVPMYPYKTTINKSLIDLMGVAVIPIPTKPIQFANEHTFLSATITHFEAAHSMQTLTNTTDHGNTLTFCHKTMSWQYASKSFKNGSDSEEHENRRHTLCALRSPSNVNPLHNASRRKPFRPPSISEPPPCSWNTYKATSKL